MKTNILESIASVPWMQAKRKPLKEWMLFGNMGSAFQAAKGFRWNAARDAAFTAFYKIKGGERGAPSAGVVAASRASASAWKALGGEQLNPLWKVSFKFEEASVWADTSNTSYEAGLSARLIAMAISCRGLRVGGSHIRHAKDRWRVWMYGYGVLCDVDGVLYCYRNIC